MAKVHIYVSKGEDMIWEEKGRENCPRVDESEKFEEESSKRKRQNGPVNLVLVWVYVVNSSAYTFVK